MYRHGSSPSSGAKAPTGPACEQAPAAGHQVTAGSATPPWMFRARPCGLRVVTADLLDPAAISDSRGRGRGLRRVRRSGHGTHHLSALGAPERDRGQHKEAPPARLAQRVNRARRWRGTGSCATGQAPWPAAFHAARERGTGPVPRGSRDSGLLDDLAAAPAHQRARPPYIRTAIDRNLPPRPHVSAPDLAASCSRSSGTRPTIPTTSAIAR